MWSRRFEGKHRPVIKRIADNISCRKNLPLSIAKKYALLCCVRVLNKRGFSDHVKYHSKEHKLVNYENFEIFRNIIPHEMEQSFAVKKVVICDIYYKSDMIVVIN